MAALENVAMLYVAITILSGRWADGGEGQQVKARWLCGWHVWDARCMCGAGCAMGSCSAVVGLVLGGGRTVTCSERIPMGDSGLLGIFFFFFFLNIQF
jgi:hypothetical protein